MLKEKISKLYVTFKKNFLCFTLFLFVFAFKKFNKKKKEKKSRQVKMNIEKWSSLMKMVY